MSRRRIVIPRWQREAEAPPPAVDEVFLRRRKKNIDAMVRRVMDQAKTRSAFEEIMGHAKAGAIRSKIKVVK